MHINCVRGRGGVRILKLCEHVLNGWYHTMMATDLPVIAVGIRWTKMILRTALHTFLVLLLLLENGLEKRFRKSNNRSTKWIDRTQTTPYLYCVLGIVSTPCALSASNLRWHQITFVKKGRRAHSHPPPHLESSMHRTRSSLPKTIVFPVIKLWNSSKITGQGVVL